MSQEVVFSLRPSDSRTFSGTAFSSLMAGAEGAVPVKLYYVRFEAGARTNWHSHSGDQVLVICAGRCRFQTAGEPVREIGVGESVRFEAGVRHWHGATISEGAEHIAINLDCRETNWLERVSEDDYRDAGYSDSGAGLIST